jgi:hypothetical protein
MPRAHRSDILRAMRSRSTTFAAMALVLAGAIAWWWQAHHGPTPTMAPADAGAPPATSPVAPATANAPAAANDRTAALPADHAAAPAAPSDTTSPATQPPRPTLRLVVRLHGLHPGAPWTAPLHLDVDGRDEAAKAWLDHDASEQPDDRGVATFVLPEWYSTATRMDGRLRAEDPHYASVEQRWEGTLDLTRELVVDVQVMAVLTGRVVDDTRAPIRTVRLTTFARRDGQPVAPELTRAHTGQDGSYRLLVPPNVPLVVVATAMAGDRRRDGGRGAFGQPDNLRPELLPNHVLADGSIGVARELPDIVLARAALLRGTVHWFDGAPIAVAHVQATPHGGAVLRLGPNALVARTTDGHLVPGGSTVTDANGGFVLPAANGVAVDIAVTRLPEVHLLGDFVRTVTPPQAIDVRLPRPIRLRTRHAGDAVASAIVEITTFGSLATNATGTLDVVSEQPLRVRATRERLRSAWVDVPADAGGTTIDLVLTDERVPVTIEFDGELRVRNTTIDWRRDDGERGSQHLARDDNSGPFRVFLEPARYRLDVGPGGGERNGVFLLPITRDVDLGTGPVALRLPATFGGMFTVTATDSSGVHVAGTCRVHDSSGADCSAPFRVRDDGHERRGKVGELLPGGTNDCTRVLAPGDYELDFEFVHHGTQRQRLTIRPREVSDVRLRLP